MLCLSRFKAFQRNLWFYQHLYLIFFFCFNFYQNKKKNYNSWRKFYSYFLFLYLDFFLKKKCACAMTNLIFDLYGTSRTKETRRNVLFKKERKEKFSLTMFERKKGAKDTKRNFPWQHVDRTFPRKLPVVIEKSDGSRNS